MAALPVVSGREASEPLGLMFGRFSLQAPVKSGFRVSSDAMLAKSCYLEEG